MSRSWQDHNPDWEYRLWTDEDLDRLVAEHYPDFLDIFRAYRNPVQRADAGRYLALHRYGGIYADIDTTCLSSLDMLCQEDRVVLAEEPREHWPMHLPKRGLDIMYFNGVMASPKGHPLWQTALDMMQSCVHARDVLDATGPMLLTGCVKRHDKKEFAFHSCHIFNPVTNTQMQSVADEYGPYAPARLSVHHWAGTWYKREKSTVFSRLKNSFRRKRARLLAPPSLAPEKEIAKLDRALLTAPLPKNINPASQKIAIFIPVRDAEKHLDRTMELIERLDVPKSNLKLVFCEGDSKDGSRVKLEQIAEQHTADYRGIELLKLDIGVQIDRAIRWKPHLQLARRSAIARVRNHLIENGLCDDDEWVLWIDADVCDYPPDIVHTLMAEREKIVVPNCVHALGEKSFDLNSFIDTREPGFQGYYKHIKGGLYQPPANFYVRLHLHDLLYMDRVPLTGVGGTMILTHSSIYRAGLRFPEKPYRDLIETEAFGRLAGDAGVQPIGLPNVFIFHPRE